MKRNIRPGRWIAGAMCILSLLLLHGCLFFNQSPIARIAASVLSGESPLQVTLDASNSSDPDGTIVSYKWDFGDGNTDSSEVVQHTFVSQTETTVFTVTLTVVDDDGARTEATQSIEVRPPETGGGGDGEAPVAQLTVDRVIGTTPLVVTFDATESTAGAGSITTYNWDFGDGETAFGSALLTHTFQPEATREYTVTLFVWNSLGNMGTAQVEIIVIVPDAQTGNEKPTAEVTMDDPLLLYKSDSLPSMPSLFEVTFDPRGSFADAGHSIEYYAWDFGDGEFAVETSDIEIRHIYKLYSQNHTYVVRLTVYDDQGLSDTKVANVTLTN